jgi:hypothetical protein
VITQQEFLAFSRVIVSEEAPEELMAFDIAGPEMIANLYSTGKAVKPGSARRAEFGFAITGEELIEFAKILTATFTCLKAASDWIHTLSGHSASHGVPEWKRELLKAGVPEAKADRIARRFSEEMKKAGSGA